ncbi:MAG: hypothetical protein A3B91_01210 [Candidatus Yanofskybacteria bacterium RIFCSPHIGHO2_02_FULL_41_29]|uniref:Uncharacterized protein n=1 Tax=Candidatus Yanofskybacteria bacterium RIFCSPHIGHO2_01_FULL_41_53 TaxID=1802663 RepID=A0A1F8EHB6_9BACT|nr:MAG: hypothetical protein A2650_01455 [Candidatus Yanofskybacteria bacterium RIFCSPHIGHO2_01_FULL_41_53]OGN11377.1 MAG: hypothetical protein A3B91_01210 [Candidatus Yanofskybacteria bacterium RIFCSPHIGHO2_02_FULL_41_29]OGN17747.1 MAG: hypothetical protein A3F48_00755 [Candidatus Yanofskybacteria bacterium RIFCSPHIGHO2_12_FULL_41_9]OGN28944.1 MAG: hypothetical protein A3H54_02280 [Candidatus Yanofskybacteria bacterium RIFCSPLOWO2_02_FULL_41_13]
MSFENPTIESGEEKRDLELAKEHLSEMGPEKYKEVAELIRKIKQSAELGDMMDGDRQGRDIKRHIQEIKDYIENLEVAVKDLTHMANNDADIREKVSGME